jgi:hypothetical protein
MNGEADTAQTGIVTGNGLGYWLVTTLTKSGRQTPQFGSVVPGTSSPGDVIFTYDAGAKSALAQATEPVSHSPKDRIVRSIGVPASKDAALFAGLDIIYYQKVADKRSIMKALDSNAIPYRVTRAQLPETFQTNAIACSLDTPIDAIKTLAHVMLDAGIPLRTILQFRDPDTKKEKIEIVSVAADSEGKLELTTPPLTRQQVDGLTRNMQLM